ncbi:glycosyltransferase family 39 protein [Rufibacter glacialis]|nr:glycosyltransferase family 39 protein [Rufibacter glacialis]
MDLWELTFSYLEYEQKAPVGFLWMSKIAVLLFGNSEMALRLFPLICGIASLFLFVPVARHFLNPLGGAVAVGIMAFAPPIVYHSVEIKQYSAELLATILCLYLYTHYHRKRLLSSLMMWGVYGAAIIWFSFTSIFILAGMAMGVTLYHLLRKEWGTVFRMVLPFSLWLISFVINYCLFTSKLTDAAWLVHYFKIRNSFMPFPPSSFSDVVWPFQYLGTRLLHYPLGLLWDVSSIENEVLQYVLRRPIFAVTCSVFGVLLIFKRDKKLLLVLGFPFLLLLIASALEVYPVWERLTVFLAPLLILIIAVGCERLAYFSRQFDRRLGFYLVLLLLAAPFYTSLKQVLMPQSFGEYKKSFFREALLEIDKHYQAGDQVYIYWNIQTPYLYYKDVLGLKFKGFEGSDFRNVSEGANDYLTKVAAEIKSLNKNKRLWVLYSKRLSMNIGEFENNSGWYVQEVLEAQKLHMKLQGLGQQVESFDTQYLNVSLYELREE